MKDEELKKTIVVPEAPRFEPSPELKRIIVKTGDPSKLNQKTLKELDQYISSVQSKRGTV